MMPLVGSAWKFSRIGSAADPLNRDAACALVSGMTAVNFQRAVAPALMDVPLIVSAPVAYLTPLAATATAVSVMPVAIGTFWIGVYPVLAPAVPAIGIQLSLSRPWLSWSLSPQLPFGSLDTKSYQAPIVATTALEFRASNDPVMLRAVPELVTTTVYVSLLPGMALWWSTARVRPIDGANEGTSTLVARWRFSLRGGVVHANA